MLPMRLPLVIAAASAALIVPSLVAAPVASAATVSCGKVEINLNNDGEGGAYMIKATNIKCLPARKLARTCLKGTVPRGWTIRHGATNGISTMRSGTRRITFRLAGGGGCGFGA